MGWIRCFKAYRAVRVRDPVSSVELVPFVARLELQLALYLDPLSGLSTACPLHNAGRERLAVKL